jgi:hypothetical protein
MKVDHRDGARGRQFPVRAERRRLDGIDVGMPVDAQHPGDVFRDLALELFQRIGKLQHLLLALRIQRGLALLEQHLRLEHEAVAHHQNVGALRQDLPRPPEEFRTVARQLLHPLRQRRVQPLAEIRDLRFGCLIARLGIGQQRVQASATGGAWRRSAGSAARPSPALRTK